MCFIIVFRIKVPWNKQLKQQWNFNREQTLSTKVIWLLKLCIWNGIRLMRAHVAVDRVTNCYALYYVLRGKLFSMFVVHTLPGEEKKQSNPNRCFQRRNDNETQFAHRKTFFIMKILILLSLHKRRTISMSFILSVCSLRLKRLLYIVDACAFVFFCAHWKWKFQC